MMQNNPKWVRDELILALDLYFQSGRKHLDDTHPEVQKLSQILRELPIHSASQRQDNFRSTSSVSSKIGNLAYLDPDGPPGRENGSSQDKVIWEEFSHRPAELHALAQAIREGATLLNAVELAEHPETDEEGFSEGRVLEKLHKYRERNKSLVKKKIQQAKQKDPELKCEVCRFSFKQVYGELGEGFAEVVAPQKILQGVTRMLADFCTNCIGVRYPSFE